MSAKIQDIREKTREGLSAGAHTSKSSLTFSVVIPLFNKFETIVGTIESILSQSYQAKQIIVVDDGSIDGGGELLVATFGERIELIRQENRGVSAARNAGIARAAGDYIAFIDADDFWAPHFLEELVLLHNDYPSIGLLASSYQYVDGPDLYTSPKIRGRGRQLGRGQMNNFFAMAANGDLPFNASSVAIKNALITQLGGFPEGEWMGEDQCVWSRIALHSTIAYSPRALSFYNRSAGNRACAASPPQTECPFSLRLNTYINNVAISAKLHRHITAYMAAHLIQLADRNIVAGQLSAAETLLSDARCLKKPIKRLRSLLRLKLAQLLLFVTNADTVTG